jgi:hypothetical protein
MLFPLSILLAVVVIVIVRIFIHSKSNSTSNDNSTASDVYWNEKEQQWEVTSYTAVLQLLQHPNMSANFLPSLMTGVDSQKYQLLVDFFARWPLFQGIHPPPMTEFRVLIICF